MMLARWPVQVVKRAMPTFVRGVQVPAIEPSPETIIASIQPATPGDYARMVPSPAGRSFTEVLCLRSVARLDIPRPTESPGDIVIHDGRRWLVMAEASWQGLHSAVSHYAYLLIQEREA